VVVFGGVSLHDASDAGLSQLVLSDPRGWSRLEAGGPSPLWRQFHSAVYDSVSARMIVFGGRGDGRLFGDTWMLSLDGAPRWTRTDSVAAAPAARFGHSAIFDPIGDRMIVFGGSVGGACFGDLWQLSLAGTPAWSPLSAGAGPTPRMFASMVYDSHRQRIVLMGGRGQDGKALNDTWFLPLANGAVWTRADSASFAPGPRWGAAATYDPDHDAIMLGFGVSDPCNGVYYGDTWILHPSDPVPAVVTASVASSNPGNVTLTWSGLPAGGCTGTVQRRTETGPWLDLVAVSPDAAGRIEIVDSSAQPGMRYGYRLVWSAHGVTGTSAESWVDVARLRFALACTNARPSREGLSVAFSLPGAGPAQIAVYDIAGRQLVRKEVGERGPGDHNLELAARGTLRPGVYLIRIVRAGDHIVTRASVLR
jgi:hypothetical protein